MKIAIIGSGISGMTAAHYLHPQHEVTVFEANGYVGGHTNTIDVESHGKNYCVDTGFIVFNDRTYPNFIKLMDELGVPSQNTPMSFSVSCEQSGLEYRGADFNGLFAQRRNVFNIKYLRLLLDLLKFNKQSPEILDDAESQTVGQFFAKNKYSQTFIDKYFLPMASAIWSCPHGTILEFPISFIVDFYRNHGLLSVNDRPQWKVISGGSRSYIPHLTRAYADRIRLNTPVQQVQRLADRVELSFAGGADGAGGTETFDHVVFACHSDQALRILGKQATGLEQEVLEAFPYEENIAVLHTDSSLMPKSRRAWACWNYHIHGENSKASGELSGELSGDASEKATVTYNMNILQGIQSKEDFLVTLNCPERVDPSKVIRTVQYHHPIFSAGRKVFQQQQNELIGPNRTSFCGAYWGNGFHEDGVVSAIAVSQYLNQQPSGESEPCTVASTKVG